MLRISKQFGVAAVVGRNDFLLVHGVIQGAADADIVERFGIDPHRQERAGHRQPAVPFQLRGAFLQAVDVLPADRFQQVEFPGAQGGDRRRLVLDRVIDDFIDERQLVFLAADLVLIPVYVVFRIGRGIAGHIIGQLKRAGADRVLPVLGAGLGQFMRQDRRIVPPAETVIPFGVEFLEREGDLMGSGGLDLVDVIEIMRDVFRAFQQVVIAEYDVVRDHFARFHHAGFLRVHDPVPQIDLDTQRVFFPAPGFREFAADRFARQPGVGDEGEFTAVAGAFRKVADEQAFQVIAGVVVGFPGPVGGVEGKRGEGDIDGADIERAAVFRFLGPRGAGATQGQQQHRQSFHGRSPIGCRACGDPADPAARRRTWRWNKQQSSDTGPVPAPATGPDTCRRGRSR